MKTKVLFSCILLSVLLVSCHSEPQPIKVTGITLNSSSLSLIEGETADLTATISPKDADNKAVIWSSSNGSVASVSNGRVSALSPGSTTITAKSDDGGFTATCAVSVAPRIIAVTSITLSKTELTLVEGESETIMATVQPDNATDKTVTWSSSDPTIATVDGGKITAIKDGTATITAKAGDQSATCNVKVEKKVIAVESIYLSKTELSLVEGESETITATVQPDNATNKTVTWSSSDSEIAIVEDGMITAKREGSATISAKAGDKSANCRVTVTHDPMKEAISFVDQNIKAALVAKFDKNKDGELSYAEASTVTSLDGVFGTTKTFSSFDEFQYFTAVTVVTRSLFEGWLLTSIKLPESIVSIGNAAFKDCSRLTSVNIPSSVKRLSPDIFNGCSRLSTVVIPNSITEIGNSAFYNCESLTSLEIPESVSAIGGSAFQGCKSLTSIKIPESITSIGPGTFRHCSSLTSILLPETVTSIGLGAFASCSSLSSINIPRGVYRLEQEIFSHCNGLKDVVIPEWVTIIGPTAFYDCKGLTTLTISESVSSIGSSAFLNCTNLTSITVKSKTPAIGGRDMLDGTNNCPIFVPSESVDSYKVAEYWNRYADRIQAIGTPQAVDLGLSVKWASFNLGATKPEEFGDYYAWGETEPYYSCLDPLTWKDGKDAGYDWLSYKWSMGTENSLTKYCPKSTYGYDGFTDDKDILDSEDDAAQIKLRGKWRMPTKEDWDELKENCTLTNTTQNGIKGRLFTAKNGNSIFIPFGGYIMGKNRSYVGTYGYYWSSTLYTTKPSEAWYVVPGSPTYLARRCGFTIRPVYAE